MKCRALISAIQHLFSPVIAYRHRRYIEDHLFTAIGAQGIEITDVLRQMVCDKQIVLTPLNNSGGNIDYIYSRSPLDAADLRVIDHHIHERNAALDPAILGHAGEIYVRQLLVRAKLFGSIPQRRRLGRIRGHYGEPADLVVRYKDLSALPMPIVCEVKNTHERFYPGSIIFGQLIKKALDRGGLPVLCVAHLSPEALVFCEEVGIGVLHLVRQVAPYDLRRKIEAVSGLIGAPPFEFINLSKPLQPLSHGKARDLSIVSNPSWLTSAAIRWERATPVLSENYDGLGKKKTWRAVLRKIYRRIVLKGDSANLNQLQVRHAEIASAV